MELITLLADGNVSEVLAGCGMSCSWFAKGGYIEVFVLCCILCMYHCVLSLVNTDRTEPVTHESLQSAGRAGPGVCAVQPAAWPAKGFGRTELKRKDEKSSSQMGTDDVI